VSPSRARLVRAMFAAAASYERRDRSTIVGRCSADANFAADGAVGVESKKTVTYCEVIVNGERVPRQIELILGNYLIVRVL